MYCIITVVKNLLDQFNKQNLYVRSLAAGWLLLMLLLPFHAFISTWGGSAIGPLAVWKAWKEITLAALVVVATIQLFADKDLARTLWSSWITRLIIAYGAWHVMIALLIGNQTEALVTGLAINLRLVTMLLVSQVVFYYVRPTNKFLTGVVLLPVAGVLTFGLLQQFVLPYDFLAHFGYRAGVTIAPFNTIDQQLSQLRIMSTLRGPNPLGAYLILPGIMVLMLTVHAALRFIKDRTRQSGYKLFVSVAMFVALLSVLYGSHARSAWLGFALSTAVYILLTVPRRWQIRLVGAGLVGIIVCLVGVYQLRATPFVQNVILHDNPEIGPVETSNSGHLTALSNGLRDIRQQPITGCGPGCAGPASFYDPDGGKLAENYYLQVGQEIGIVGLGIFMAIIALVGHTLYKKRSDPLALVLFVSLIGISAANLLLHVWADDTIAYVWWGLAGAVLAPTSFGTAKSKR